MSGAPACGRDACLAFGVERCGRLAPGCGRACLLDTTFHSGEELGLWAGGGSTASRRPACSSGTLANPGGVGGKGRGLWNSLPAAFLLCPAFLPSVFPTPHTGTQAKFRATFQHTPPPHVTGVFKAPNEWLFRGREVKFAAEGEGQLLG